MASTGHSPDDSLHLDLSRLTSLELGRLSAAMGRAVFRCWGSRHWRTLSDLHAVQAEVYREMSVRGMHWRSTG